MFLYMRDENGFQLYQEDILNKLEFSWGGFKINGTEMKMVKSTGSTNMDDLNEFTFLSPVLDLQPDILMENCTLNTNETISESKFICKPQECKLWLHCCNYTNIRHCSGTKNGNTIIIQ